MELRDYAAQDAVGLAALIRGGEVSAAEVEDAARRAIEQVEPALQATVGGLLEAAIGEEPGGSGAPFAGVPFAMKEVGPHLAGQTSQLGSRLAGDGLTAAADTDFGARVRAAGLRVLARTRSPEFAFNATTEPAVHGAAHSPWDLERSVGGSSGGAGALVAARALPIAHATDGGGSIRIPASLCGLVGLKPSRLRTPVGPGQWENNHGMGHDFLLCRTVRDAAAALDALHGPAPGDKYVIAPPARPFAEEVGAEPGRLRIAWTADAWSGAAVDAEVRAAVEAAARTLAGLGHELEADTPMLDPERLHLALVTTWSAGLAQRAAQLGTAMQRDVDTSVEACSWATIAHGRSLSAVDLLDGYAHANAVGRTLGSFFEGADLLLLPSAARIPWRLGELDQDDSSLDGAGWTRRLFDHYVPFTAMFNISGQPAISLPLGSSAAGLPIGVQLVARYCDEATLLRVAAQLEQAMPWAGRVPAVVVG